MCYSHNYIFILLLNRVIHTILAGQFFQITKNDLDENKDQPFLANDAFQCSRQQSCTAVTRRKDLDGKVFFAMSKTEDPSVKYSSCAGALAANGYREGYYKIRYGSMNYLEDVECKVINGRFYALIHHDSESTIEVSGYEDPGEFRKSFKYTSSLESVINFVNSSASCRQFTRFDCHHALIYQSNVMYSYLVDRNSVAMSYIGGGPTAGKGCHCGITDTCHTRGHVCNCDTNDEVWRNDKGFVTERHRLPLIEVRIGDTGSSYEKMKYTIGPLECISEI